MPEDQATYTAEPDRKPTSSPPPALDDEQDGPAALAHVVATDARVIRINAAGAGGVSLTIGDRKPFVLDRHQAFALQGALDDVFSGAR
jgi:hypothetical protein